MTELEDARGILFPARLPTFHRIAAPADLAQHVRWFWHPRWRLAPGRVSRQEILPFPASNLVVTPHGVMLAGPTTRVSHRDLTGTGWAFGALLRPAGLAALCPEPWRLRDAESPVAAARLLGEVTAALADDGETGRRGAAEAFARWLRSRCAHVDDGARTANALEDLVARDREIVRVDQLAERLGVSVRTVQRLTRRYVGLAPLALVRRYRLQEAAQRARDGAVSPAEIAAELGYVDQSHLTSDFRQVLGLTPAAYLRAARTSPGVEAGVSISR